MSVRPTRFERRRFALDRLDGLLPIGPAFRHVDEIVGYAKQPVPGIRTTMAFAPEDPMFEAHFRGRPVVPGSRLIEVAAQSAGLLVMFQAAREMLAASGEDAEDVFAPDVFARLSELHALTAVLAEASVKVRHPVGPGERVTTDAWLVRRTGSFWRLDVDLATRATALTGSITLASNVDWMPAAPSQR